MRIVWFDVCALSVLLVILYTYIIKRNLRVRQNYIFMTQLIIVLITTVGGLMSTLAQDAVIAGAVSWLNSSVVVNGFTYLYMAMHILSPVIFVLYIYAILGLSMSRLSENMLVFLPVSIVLLMLAVTPATGFIFYYDEYNIYHRGSLLWAFYLVSAYYCLYCFFLVMEYRKTIKKELILSITFFVAFSITGVLIQFFSSMYAVEDFCNSLVLLMLYILVERPADYVDSQTDLQNANAFFVCMATKFKRKASVELIILTIDNIGFLDKQIGTAQCDTLLVEVSNFLEGFGKSATIYRLNRGAFALQMKSNPEFGSDILTERIRDRFKYAFTTETYNILLFECCMRINCPEDVNSSEELQHLISLALVPDLHRSRHICEISDLDIESDKRKKKIEKAIRSMVEKGTEDRDIIIKYQPVYNVRNGRFDGIEMRTVLHSKELGVITRREYITVSQNIGAGVRLGQYLFNEMCSFIENSEILELGIQDFALEMPTAGLMIKGACDKIIEITDSHNLPHHLITFELSQDVLMNYHGTVEKNIETLRERGFGFSLINYGTGYTDAGILLNMPLSIVTFDRELTKKGITDKKADTLLRSSIDMLKDFNLKVKAEGIENEKVCDYATELGVDVMQGYYLAMIFSKEDLINFLREKQSAV